MYNGNPCLYVNFKFSLGYIHIVAEAMSSLVFMDRRMDEKIYVPLKLPAIAHGPAADVQLLACRSLPRCVCVSTLMNAWKQQLKQLR